MELWSCGKSSFCSTPARRLPVSSVNVAQSALTEEAQLTSCIITWCKSLPISGCEAADTRALNGPRVIRLLKIINELTAVPESYTGTCDSANLPDVSNSVKVTPVTPTVGSHFTHQIKEHWGLKVKQFQCCFDVFAALQQPHFGFNKYLTLSWTRMCRHHIRVVFVFVYLKVKVFVFFNMSNLHQWFSNVF